MIESGIEEQHPSRSAVLDSPGGRTLNVSGRIVLKRLAVTTASVVVVLAAYLALYHFVYLPWNFTWGATDEEVAMRMAGDEICPMANFSPTRAITIEATPENVWPWILQMGYRRAGFYSYDFLDNNGEPSANRIIPELQNVKVGDKIALDRNGGLFVRTLEPNRRLVLASKRGWLTWAWHLDQAGPGRTRVVTRVRAGLGELPMKIIWESFEIFMMRKCLLGIKHRAECL